MTGKQLGELIDILATSFNQDTFPQFLAIRLNKTLTDYSSLRNNFRTQIFEVVEGAKQEVWVEDLVDAAANERSRNIRLQNFAADILLPKFNLYQAEPNQRLNKAALESLVNDVPRISPDKFIAGLMYSKKCVCRIQSVNKYGDPMFGTGFLVGPDLVLTNYHVVEDVIKQREFISSVICKFDYEVLAGGSLNTGRDVALSKNPFLAYSAYGTLDAEGSKNIDVDWPEDKLDYALLQLATKVGEEPFGIRAERAIPDKENRRGWINQTANPIQYLEPGGHMIILQHPDREPVSIGFGFEKVLGHDQKRLRVRYAINTMGGSSGSPCFNENFGWVALHNMGDPAWVPTYNQGIPADKIIQDLNNKGIVLINS